MPILWDRMGEGTQTINVAYAFPTDFPPAPWTYIFLIRNQNAGGTWTPTNMVQMGNDTASSNRMSVWRVTGPNPTLRMNATTALIQWVAVGSQEEALEVRFGYASSNVSTTFPTPAAFSTQGPAIVVWGTNTGVLWNPVLPGSGAVMQRTAHTAAKPSAMLGTVNSPVPVASRQTSGSYIEHVAALRMAPPTFVPPAPEIWNGTRWVAAGAELWNGTSWRTDGEIWNGTRWVPLRTTTAPTVSAITTTGSSNWDDQPQFFQVTTTGPVSRIDWTFQNGTPATAVGPPSGLSAGPVSWAGKPGTYQVVATVVGPGGTVQSTRDHSILDSSGRP